jgi:hypothetical protein
MPPADAKQEALALLASLPASPTQAQLQQLSATLTQAFEGATASAASAPGCPKAGKGKPDAAGLDVKQLAKEAGPLAMGEAR